MLCSELELGLSENHEGILILPEDTPVGSLLNEYLGDVIFNFDIKGGFSHLLSILGISRQKFDVWNFRVNCRAQKII